MAYNEKTNYANERKYLNNLISGGGGNAEWAKNQMKALNSAEQKYGNPGGGSSGGSSGGSGGGYTQKTGKAYYYDTEGPTQTGWVREDGSAPNLNYKDTTPYANGTKPAIKGADLSRDMRWAGKTVQKNGYAITYDENGYAVSATNVRNGAAREDLANVYPRVDADGELIYPTYADGTRGSGYAGTSGGSRTTPDGFQGSATGVRTNYEDQDAIRERMNENSKRWHSASDEERERLHAENERLADQINQTGGDVSFDPATGTWTGTAGTRRQQPQVGYGGGVSTPTISGLTNRAPDLTSTLDKWLAAAREQAKLQADYATKTGIDELKRAEEDAQAQFQTQRNQIEVSRAKASDNQALYNERRGDRGGIGAAQYDSIANTAAQNQLAVNQAQVKLSTDTARQIADLRAQGEFQKADALLQLSQTYLQQLISIQQWGAEFNLSVDQFNKQLGQWNYEFELKVADLLGNYRGQPTLASKQYDFDREYKTAGLTGTFRGQQTLEAQAALAEAGIALAQAGIQPSTSQLEAMRDLYGYDENAVSGLVQTAKLAQQAKLKSKSSGSKTSGGKKTTVSAGDAAIKTAKAQYENGNSDAAYATLVDAYVPSVVEKAASLVFESDDLEGYTGRMTSGEALNAAVKASSLQSGQLAYLQELYQRGRITEAQLNDIAYAIVGPQYK